MKKGMLIKVGEDLFRVLELQHVTPGNLRGFVRVKFRNIRNGALSDQKLRSEDSVERAVLDERAMQYMYRDGDSFHFMDTESYEQMAIPESTVADALKWTKPNETVDVLFIDGSPSDLQLPASVELEVTQTDPGLRGDTASGGGNKPATLETGATINVPLFVDVGQRVKVDTRSGEYMSRA